MNVPPPLATGRGRRHQPRASIKLDWIILRLSRPSPLPPTLKPRPSHRPNCSCPPKLDDTPRPASCLKALGDPLRCSVQALAQGERCSLRFTTDLISSQSRLSSTSKVLKTPPAQATANGAAGSTYQLKT